MMRRAMLLGLLLAATGPLWGLDLGSGAVGADWTQLGADGRSAGMADAMTAVDGGMASLGSDPAGLASLRLPTLTAGYLAWVEGTSLQSLAWGMPAGPGVMALGLDYFSAGAVDRVNAPVGGGAPQVGGSVGLLFLNVGLSWAQGLGPLQYGLTVHLLDQALDGAAGWGLAADLGLRYRLARSGFSAGAALQSWGPPLQGADLPRGWRAGVAYRPPALPRTLLSVDYEALVADAGGALLNAGLELRVLPRFSLRGGVKMGAAGSAQGFTAGASFVTGSMALHYAYQRLGALDAAHLISVEFTFDPAPCSPPPKTSSKNKAKQPRDLAPPR